MPHEIEIEMVHRRRRSHRPMSVQRCTLADMSGVRWVDHLYRPADVTYFRQSPGWQWNDGGWMDPRPRNGDQGATWAYLIRFRDGSFGACRVRDINEALAELGARVDGRGDA